MNRNPKVGFEMEPLMLPLSEILPVRHIANPDKNIVRYQAILKSIKEVGMIEPLIVYKKEAIYLLMDGHLRHAALLELGETEANCLLSTDDECYTYNARVSRLSPIQEHAMITKSVKAGVTPARIAASLNLDISRVFAIMNILEGIHEDAVELLKAKPIAHGTITFLKRVSGIRQIEMAQLMVSANNFSAGYPIEIHHIDEDPSNSVESNLVVLCRNCHGDVHSKAGLGRQWNTTQIAKFRESWYQIMEQRRKEAADVALLRDAPARVKKSIKRKTESSLMKPVDVKTYLEQLPSLRRAIHKSAQPKWDSGNTGEMCQGNRDVIDVLEQILVTLIGFYPEGHFGDDEPKDYVSELVARRYLWHRARLEPEGVGTGGTIMRVIVGGLVTANLESMVAELVEPLSKTLDGFDFSAWEKDWATEPTQK